MGGKKANVVVNQDKLSWLRETLEWQKDMQDPQEFLNTLKTELFEDEVYVFTPKGKNSSITKRSYTNRFCLQYSRRNRKPYDWL